MHIPQWNAAFLSKVSPERYVDLMVRANATAVMVYANSHVGLCNWPTRTGEMHAGLNGRDFFGSVLALCRKRKLGFVAYYSLIFNNWAFINHPEWRIVPLTGNNLPPGRYGWCCPNSPGYRDFVTAQIEELFSRYECDGVFYDMTFWPEVCYCAHCVARYRREKGAEPPRKVDWNSPGWLEFQRWREACIDEFAEFVTAATRKVRPQMTVTHQFSTILAGPMLGVPFSLANHSDYLSGDFYGEAIQQSIVCKAFHALSKNRPFEFHTSRCLSLNDHVTIKSPHRLASQAFLAPAHSSAFMFIDAIDPVGTLSDPVYSLLGSVFERMAKYEPFAGGKLLGDVAVYLSNESKFDPDSSDEALAWASPMPHWEALLGACRALKEAHIPFGVVTKYNLDELDGYHVLVLPEVLLMDEQEVEIVRSFVENGGGLYASGRTSTRRMDGTVPGDFMLGEVFGVSHTGQHPERLTFLSAAAPTCREWFDPQEHVIHTGAVQRVESRGADVWATLTLSYTDPDGGELFGPTFSSIHSNPPGPTGSEPALVANTYGLGKVFYSTAALEATDHPINRSVFAHIIGRLLSHPRWFEADIHPCVEVVAFDQPGNARMLVSLVNAQAQTPNVAVTGVCRVRVPPGRTARRLVKLPDETPIDFNVTDRGYAEFLVDRLEVFEQFMLLYE